MVTRAGSNMGAPPVALGLYSVRDLFEGDPARTLERTAEMGFAVVEPYAIGQFATQLAKLLPSFGLTAPVALAGPRGLPEEQFYAGAAAVGAKTLIIPGSDPTSWTTEGGINAVIDDLLRIADQAAAYGLSVGYHNHDFEARCRVNGRPALEYFASILPEPLGLEVDIYWLERGGLRAVDFLSQFAHRVHFIHAKDASPDQNGTMSPNRMDQQPAGKGMLQWNAILAAAPALDAVIVEFDEYRGDVFTACATALETLTNIDVDSSRG